MQKEFVPYELALRLKALGFEEECFYYWEVNTVNGLYHLRLPIDYNTNHWSTTKFNEEPLNILAPIFQQTFRWFREKYNAVCEIIRKEDGNHSEFIGWVFINNRKIDVVSYWDSKTYEEAELACLDKLIQIVKEKL